MTSIYIYIVFANVLLSADHMVPCGRFFSPQPEHNTSCLYFKPQSMNLKSNIGFKLVQLIEWIVVKSNIYGQYHTGSDKLNGEFWKQINTT